MKLIASKFLVKGLFALAVTFSGSSLVLGETIAVIGTGNVGGALGPRFATLGHNIIYGSREPDRQDVQALVTKTGHNATAMLPAAAAAEADIVVMATKWAQAEVALKSLGDLAGKIILDPNNAVRVDSSGKRHHDVETSAGQMIQDWVPNAMAVKAFNTLAAGTMANPASAGGPVTIPIAGNDPDAKETISSLVTGIGFEVVDMGNISASQVLEKMLVERGNANITFNYYFRPVPQ